MTKEEVIKLLNIYGEAWMKQDSELILTIFTPDAMYNDPKEPINYGHDGIRAYWIKKVIGEQSNITFKLLNTWVDGDTVIAEWNAIFTDIKRNLHIDMNEVGVFTVKDNKFSALREYYNSVKNSL